MKHLLSSAACLMTLILTDQLSAQTTVTQADWGKTGTGQPVSIYSLHDADLDIRITTFGARIVSIEAPDKQGTRVDVVLGYNDVGRYESDTSTYFGAIVGRYGNRIAKGAFTLDGKTYQVPLNNKGNALHGGPQGFDHKVWKGTKIHGGVEMVLVSPDGDMGFPGELTARVRYTLAGKSLRIEYNATTTKPTVVNLTNHSYFNLGGEAHGTILDEEVSLNASRYTPVDAGLIPLGHNDPVAGSPFDFKQKPVSIGARIDAANEQLKLAGGYDHNFVLDGGQGSKLHLAAKVVDPRSGRTLTVTTTEPGVQFYSGNFLDGTLTGISGTRYAQHAGFCLETQHFPDSPNQPAFPTTLLTPGKPFHSTTVFTFGVAK